MLYVPVNTFFSNVGKFPGLLLLQDIHLTQWSRWGLNQQLLDLKSGALPLSQRSSNNIFSDHLNLYMYHGREILKTDGMYMYFII